MAKNDDRIDNSLNDILSGIESMANISEDPDTREQRMEAELQNLQQNEDEESVSDDQNGGGDSSPHTESEGDSESSYQQPNDDAPVYYSKWSRAYMIANGYEVCVGLCCLYNREMDLPLFKRHLAYYDFHLWIYDVDLYLEFYEIPEDRKVELVASRLREGALTWWEQYQNPKKQPIQEWKLMKWMLIAQFLKVDYDRVIDLPILKKNTNPDEFREWVWDVEKAFELHKIKDQSLQAELVAYRLEGGAFSWWQRIQNLSCQIYNKPIEEWKEMKKILLARFLSAECDRVEYDRIEELPRFKTNFSFDEFSEWVGGVERFFELYETPKDLQVGLVASRFEDQTALTWWRKMQYLSMRVDEQPIQEWKVMKTMLMTRFLSADDFDLSLVNKEDKSFNAEE